MSAGVLLHESGDLTFDRGPVGLLPKDHMLFPAAPPNVKPACIRICGLQPEQV